MKTITINVSESVYRELKEYARRQDRTASELIREAMATYMRDRVQAGSSLRDLPPVSLGRVKKYLTRNDEFCMRLTVKLHRYFAMPC